MIYKKLFLITLFFLQKNLYLNNKIDINLKEKKYYINYKVLKNVIDSILPLLKTVINKMENKIYGKIKSHNKIKQYISDKFYIFQNYYLHIDKILENENEIIKFINESITIISFLKYIFHNNFKYPSNKKHLLQIKNDFFIKNTDLCNQINDNILLIINLEKEYLLNIFQKIYRKIYFQLQESKIFNKYIKYSINNPLLLLSVYCSYDLNKYMIDKKKSTLVTSFQIFRSMFFGYEIENKEQDNEKIIKNHHPIIFKYIIPIFSGIVLYQYLNYILERGYLDSIKKIFHSIQNYFIGEKNKKIYHDNLLQEIVNYDAEAKNNLNHNSFDYLRKRKLLNWFDSVSNNIQDIYNKKTDKIAKELPKVIMITGESGNGKTHLIRSFHHTISEIANLYGEESQIEFLPLEAKHFLGPVIDRWKCPIDILDELEKKLEIIKYKKKIIIIHFDEFHLYFYNEYGNLSQSRIADFLKFFSMVKEKQEEDCAGALFVILTTNKEEFIPYEMYTNPSRINTIIKIPNPSYEERIDIINNFFKGYGVSTANIDVLYLSKIMNEYDLSNGSILNLLKHSINKSKYENKIVDLELIYSIFNEKIRNISYDINYHKNNIQLQKLLSIKYASIIAFTILLEETNLSYNFDCATIYPIKNCKGSWPSNHLHIKNNFETEYKYGDIFFIENDYYILNKEKIIFKIIQNLIGKLYLQNKYNIVLEEVKFQYEELYDILYRYFLLYNGSYYLKENKINNIDEYYKNHGINIKSEYINKYNCNEINYKINQIIYYAEIYMKEYINNIEIENNIELISDTLLKNKIITNKEISEENKKQILIKEKSKFNILINKIAQLFNN